MEKLLKSYDGDQPGASVVAVRGCEIVLRRSHGLRDVDGAIAATPDTNFRLASVTKQFTAAAILQLEVSLTDRVAQYLPVVPSGVTIEHLLTHSSGLLDYEDLIAAGTTSHLSDADVLDLIGPQTTKYFEPGSSYRYSNTGYALLALIVEKISGRSFGDYLRDEIFVPLGMRNTVAHREGITTVSNRAFGHSRDGKGWRRTDQSLTSAVLGDGGVYSSADDLARWLAALDGGMYEEAMKPRVATDDPKIRYGYGWRTGEHEGRRIAMHTGETIGFRNALVRFPDERLAVTVLTNRDEGKPLEIALAIASSLR